MVEDILMPVVVARIVDVLFDFCLPEPLEVVILEQLYTPLILQDLYIGDEDIPLQLPGQGRTDPDHYFDVVSLVAVF